MRSRTLHSELRLSFGLLLAMVALVGLGGVAATVVTGRYVEQAAASVGPAMRTNSAILQSMTDVETGLRGYVLSTDRSALQPYRRGLQRLPEQRRRLRHLLRDDPAGQRLLDRQSEAIDTWLRAYGVPRVHDPVGLQNFNVARFQHARRLFDDLRAANTATEVHLGDRLDGIRDRADSNRGLIAALVVALTLAGLVGGFLASRATSRRVRRPLLELRDVLTALIAGERDARTEPRGPREVVTIARSVNALADETDRLRGIEEEERRLQERLLEFGREVRSSLDPDEVVRHGLAELGEGLGLDRAYVRLVEDDELQAIGAQWCRPGVAALTDLKTPGSMGVLRALYKRRRPMTTYDVLDDPFFDTERGRHWRETTGARASMTLPIGVDDVPAGVITCMDFEPREWTDLQIHLAESVASDLGRALEHAKLYTAQVEAVRRLEALDRSKDEFLSSVSHELRTPLTSINGYVELLEEDDIAPMTSRQRRLITVVRRNVDRLRLLIEDLLTLSRIESGAFRSTLRAVDVVELVRTCVEDMRPQAAAAAVEVVVDDLVGRPLAVEGDPSQLARAVLNVLGNAIKFTPGEGRVDVCLRVDDAASTLSVEVADTGMGIPAADLPQVASRFYRAGNAVSAEVPGTGLGLVIVRTILDNHGGRLDVRSREGEGTTVRMTLPCSGHARDEAPRRESVGASAEPE